MILTQSDTEKQFSTDYFSNLLKVCLRGLDDVLVLKILVKNIFVELKISLTISKILENKLLIKLT